MDRFNDRVAEAIAAIDRGGRYCAPVDAHSVDVFEARVAAIRFGFKRWQDRDVARWPDIGQA